VRGAFAWKARNSSAGKYGAAARQVRESGATACCDPGLSCLRPACHDPNLYGRSAEDGLPASVGAWRRWGCGNPTALIELKPGETVLSLGSGGGIDVLLSARRVGPTGKALALT